MFVLLLVLLLTGTELSVEGNRGTGGHVSFDIAVVDGTVAAVYIPHKWKYTDNPQYEGRCEFVGIEDVGSEYLGKTVASIYGKSQNPVKYINL